MCTDHIISRSSQKNTTFPQDGDSFRPMELGVLHYSILYLQMTRGERMSEQVSEQNSQEIWGAKMGPIFSVDIWP